MPDTMGRILDLTEAAGRAMAASLSLVASENVMSAAARAAVQADLGHRYLLPADRPASIWDYPNQGLNRELAAAVEGLACRLYDGQYADVRPLSGNNVAYIVINSMVPRGGTIFRIPSDCGGHFATPPICDREGIAIVDIPYDRAAGTVDLAGLRRLYARHRPHLVFLDASMVLFPHPTAAIREAVGPAAVISNDCSHVFGLVAGGGFPNPLPEGADLIHGSTHKTLFGPQKGLIVCRERGEVARRIHATITPLFVSNAHLHHVAALGVALEELALCGREYAAQVIANARTLAAELDRQGFEIFAKDRGFTASHQVWWVIGGAAAAHEAFARFEAARINVNLIEVPFTGRHGFRLGTAELTRRGFQRDGMIAVARLMADCLRGTAPPATLRGRVQALAAAYPALHYPAASGGGEPGPLAAATAATADAS